MTATSMTIRPAFALHISRERIYTILLILLCKAILDYSYAAFVSPLFAYAGYSYDPSWGRLVLSYVVVFGLAAFTPLRDGRPSSAFIYLYMLLILIPVASLWALRSESDAFMALMLASYLIVLGVVRTPNVIASVTIRHGERIAWLVYAVLLAYLLAIILQRGGLGLITFNPWDIYNVRDLAHDQVFFGFGAYAIEWFGKTAGPIAMVLFLARRNYLGLTLVIAIQVIIAGIAAAKEYWIYPVLVMATYYIASRGRSLQVSWGILIVAALTFALALGLMTDLIMIPGIILNRSFFSAANLHYQYYHFFQENPLVYMSNTALSFFAEYPYRDTVPSIIGFGQWGFGRDTFANAGVFASAYMHFGGPGMLIFAVFVGLLLKLYDFLIIGRMPLKVGIAAAVVPALQLVNGDLAVSLLSHGMALSFIFLLLIGRRDFNDKNASRGFLSGRQRSRPVANKDGAQSEHAAYQSAGNDQ